MNNQTTSGAIAPVQTVVTETTELVPVFMATIGGVEQQVCDARTLHAFLEVGRDFSNWFKELVEKYEFVENQDFALIRRNGGIKTGRGGDRRSKDYILCLDMAKESSMVQNNTKGREARRYFIAMERQAIALLASNPVPTLPALITTAQVGELSTLIAERFPEGKHRPYAWSRFKNHFRIASYRELPADRLEEACVYIQIMPGAKEQAALPAPTIDPELTPISDRLAHGRFLATFDNNRLHLREIEHDAYIMADHRWPNVIRQQHVTTEVLLDLLDAVAAKLNRRAS